jgi:hypothetical protein
VTRRLVVYHLQERLQIDIVRGIVRVERSRYRYVM